MTPPSAPRYQHPYPSAELASTHPFVTLDFVHRSEAEITERAVAFEAEMAQRRSVRMFSDEPVPRALVESAIRTASSAPAGAHKQPWTFVAVDDPAVKREIRLAAEEEERRRRAIIRALHKEFLEIAPWIVVLFEQRYEVRPDGTHRKHYYVKESVGMAAGLFIAALHHMGLATLPHTPTPMAFLRRILERPANERPFVMFPVGFPVPGTRVPDLRRKTLDEVAVFPERRTVP